MGLRDSREFLDKNFVTAIIVDGGNRSHSVPIKYTVDDYFFATIDRQRYAFKFVGQRIITWKQTFRKTFRYINYTTDHYMPLSFQDNKNLEMVLKINSLPKINGRLYDLFGYLAKREKRMNPGEEFQEHDLDKVVEMVTRHEKEYPEAADNLRNFFEKLDITKIVTPVKPLHEFLTDELKTTDAKFLGDVENQMKKTEQEQRKMSNTEVNVKKPLMKIILLCMIVVGLGVAAYWLYSSGGLSHGLPGMSLPGQTPAATTSSLAQQYPTPEALKAAVDAGKVKMSDLPKEMQDWVNNYKPPVATPTPIINNGSH